jgi:hypothetical protein
MSGLADRIHRTWIEYLLAANLREVAALVADAEISEIHGNFSVCGLNVDLTPSAALYMGTRSRPEGDRRSDATTVEGGISDRRARRS